MAYKANTLIDGKVVWFQVETDEAIVLEMVKKAVKSKGQRSKDGPVTIKILPGHRRKP